jgi:adenosylcobinamide-phosphate synthase
LKFTPFELLAGLSLDLLIGDPRWMPHPVRAIGWLTSVLERALRRSGIPLRLAGVLLWILIVGTTAGLVWLTLPWANIYWIYALVAIRSLDNEAHKVMRFLERGDIVSARKQLGMIVGRDTDHLEEPEIIRAVIETVSENLSDGIVAPLFYLTLGGPAAMAAYKAINTLDSIVGYRNPKYEEFGWFSAKMDDIANFLPARMTALLVWLSSLVLWMNVGRSVRVTLRDAATQPSPNSGFPEAAFAGAIGVQLGGCNSYSGVVSEKPTMGDAIHPLNRDAWEYARGLLFVATFWMTLFAVLVVGW